MKRILFVILLGVILLIAPESVLEAKEISIGISDEEFSLIDTYVKSEDMINRIEDFLQNRLDVSDIDCKRTVKVNVLPYNYIDSYGQSRDIKEMYGTQWQYKIPMVIDEKKLVITLNINPDNTFEYVGMSYGEENKIFFINTDDIYYELQRTGISVEDIIYSDILYSYDTNTLFIHFNMCKEDDYETMSSKGIQPNYLIPYSTTDFETRYVNPENKYENGVLKPAVEILFYIGHTDSYYKNFDGRFDSGELNGGYQAVKQTNELGTGGQLNKKESGNKMVIGGLLLMLTTLAVIIGYNMKNNKNL